MTSIIR